MRNSEIHWKFAISAAIHLMEQFVYDFDFLSRDSQQKNRAYAGANPRELIKIIDSFLEDRSLLDGGHIASLERYRNMLDGKISNIYEQGRLKAQLEWKDKPEYQLNDMANLDFDDFRAIGRNHGSILNLSPSDLAWFVEGFSKQWREEWVDYLKRTNNL